MASTYAADVSLDAQRSLSAVRSSLLGKRVAMVTFSPFPADPRPRRAAEAFAREGALVDLICIGGDNAPSRETLRGIKVLRIPFRRYRGGALVYAYQYAMFILVSSVIFAFRSLIRRYNLVHVHNMPDILVASALIPKMRGAKVLLDLHDPMPELMMTIFNAEEHSRSVRLLRRLEKWSLRRADLVVTVNRACRRIFSSRSCSAERIAVVMNAPDEQIFPFQVPQLEPTVKNKGFVIMYHGTLVERNGLDLAVEALAHVRSTLPAAELWIYGARTPFLERVLETAKQKGLQPGIRYFGSKPLDEIVQAIRKCDIGVIPNQWNPFTEINTPVRIFEYLALGKPVIAPSTAGIRDYFDNGSLVFFEAGNSKDLAKKIMYAFSHPQQISEIVRRGQDVYQQHTWDRERELLLDRVRKILAV